MGQVIHFPSGVTLSKPPPARPRAREIAPHAGSSSVTPISRRVRLPKKNRPEDDGTIMFASIVRTAADHAHQLAQTAPNSEAHLTALHMTGIASKLPRNNLRVLTTRDDVLLGAWRLWQRVKLANLEWELCDARRLEASRAGDEEAKRYWSGQQDEADKRRWHEYERLARVPARTLADFKTYKLVRFGCGMGDLNWMRQWKPDLAAILDEEVERLTAEKAKRAAKRAAKKGAA